MGRLPCLVPRLPGAQEGGLVVTAAETSGGERGRWRERRISRRGGGSGGREREGEGGRGGEGGLEGEEVGEGRVGGGKMAKEG